VARSNAVTMDGLALVRIAMPATRVLRTRALIRRNPVDHWVVTTGLTAKTHLTIGNDMHEVPARSPFVMSLADEMISERGPDERLQLYLARDNFRDLAPVLDAARAAVVTGPLGKMLAEFLELLDRNLRWTDAANADRLKNAVGSMIATCVSPSLDRLAAAEGQLNLGRLERVRRVVRQQLRSPLLEPAMLSRSIGMSRSALYRLMESQGGITRFIRRQRLLESRAVLSAPGCDKPIATIAEEFCFSDAADFSRAFRREFGLSPSDARATAQADLIPPSPGKGRMEGGELTFSDFIQAL
jgi:AraC-like DNA-binding protein